MKNPYETLGILQNASPEEIKQAYRDKAKQAHPDVSGQSGAEMADINAAYELLSDPVRRQKYDQTGETGERDSIEAQAIRQLQELSVLLFAGGNWAMFDLIQEMRGKVKMRQQIDAVKRRDLEGQLEKWLDGLKRAKRKGDGENMLVEAFRQEIHGAKIMLASMDERDKIALEMERQLDLYEWKTDKTEGGLSLFALPPRISKKPTVTIWG